MLAQEKHRVFEQVMEEYENIRKRVGDNDVAAALVGAYFMALAFREAQQIEADMFGIQAALDGLKKE